MLWVVVAAINCGLVASVVRARRGGEPRKRVRRLAWICVSLLLASAGIGVIIGLASAIAAVTRMGDPSQKARVLAEGISEAINLTAFAILAFFAPAVISIVVLFRTPEVDEPTDSRLRP
jgi:hypothetical protein